MSPKNLEHRSLVVKKVTEHHKKISLVENEYNSCKIITNNTNLARIWQKKNSCKNLARKFFCQILARNTSNQEQFFVKKFTKNDQLGHPGCLSWFVHGKSSMIMDFSTQYFYFHGKSWMATFSYLPISIIYRTSREPPTQNKDIFQLLNALLSVELNVRHYVSNSFCFSSSNGEWSKIGPYPSFLKAVLAIGEARFNFF